MPNHIHGIIIIGANKYNSPLDTHHSDGIDAQLRVSPAINQFVPQSNNLLSIIRGYKSALTTCAKKNGIEFDWQNRFYDYIVRSMDEYYRISIS